MDEITRNVAALIDYIEANSERISPAMQREIATFLSEVQGFIEQERRPVEANIPASAGLLWFISGGNPDVFVSYLRQIPDAELNGLLNNQEQLKSIIERLSQNQPQDRNRIQEGFLQAPIQSSNIFGYDYDPSSQTLLVKFQGDGVYQYEGVPPQVYQIFANGAIPAKTDGQNEFGQWWVGKNPSLGAAFYEMIKSKGYQYQKVA